MNKYPYAYAFSHETLEVVDEHDVPLLLMPGPAVREQNLPHREVRISLRDARGRVLLIRKPSQDGAPSPWALPGGCVQAGESREDAALRILEKELGLEGVPLLLWEDDPQGVLREHLTLFHSVPGQITPKTAPSQELEFLYLDRDELNGLALHFPDLLVAPLVRFITRAPHVLHLKR